MTNMHPKPKQTKKKYSAFVYCSKRIIMPSYIEW